MLRRAEAAIAARGLNVSEWSARTYHYKNEYLRWNYSFETRRPRGSEIEKVIVTVSLDEGEPGAVTVWWRAELFQVGSLSRWQSAVEMRLSLEDAERKGLAAIVLEAADAGEAALAAVV